MKISTITLALSLALLVALAGCGGGKNAPSKTTPFIGGTTGLQIELQDNAPPAEVYDDGSTDFNIALKLKNMGEADIEADDIQVSVNGLPPGEFGKTDNFFVKNAEEKLNKKQKTSEGDIIEGGVTFVSFDDLSYAGNLAGNTQKTISIDTCYKYSNYATTDVCLLKDLTDKDGRGVCAVTETKPAFNSGGPVHVTNVKEYIKGNKKVGFDFTITHSGAGRLFKMDTQCNTSYSDKNVAWVEITPASTDIQGLKCAGLQDGDDTSGYVMLFNGERVISCTADADVQTDFESTIQVKTTYDYEQTVGSTILIKETNDK